MSRPKIVKYDTFHLYDKLHTEKSTMISGNEITTLFPIKETKYFYHSIQVWSPYASYFRAKKPFQLQLNIPVVENQKSIDFLEKKCWKNWITTQKKSNDTDEALELMKRIFPDKEYAYFYELESIIGAYCFGNFGSKKDPLTEYDREQQLYYNNKYNRDFGSTSEIKRRFDAWTKAENKSEKEKDELYNEYYKYTSEYHFQKNNLIDTFIDISSNSVCYPVAFSDNTAEWSREKYGKLLDYAYAGEIMFVVTPQKIYFEIKRHF